MKIFMLTGFLFVQIINAQQQYSAHSPPAALAYTKVQQHLQQQQQQQPAQYYPQQVASPSTYSVPQQQYQYQPQAVNYAQQGATRVTPTAYKQPFSFANEVSSFTYSSPVVQYNNLGLLSQVIGKGIGPSQAGSAPSSASPVYSSAPQAQAASYEIPQQYLSQYQQPAYTARTQAYQTQQAPEYSQAQQYATAQQLKQLGSSAGYSQQ